MVFHHSGSSGKSPLCVSHRRPPSSPYVVLSLSARPADGAGVAYSILTDYRVGGLVIDNYRTTLPLKKGLSSSAAICVLVARAFNRVYDLKMTREGPGRKGAKGCPFEE
jgi:hypothetical protein